MEKEELFSMLNSKYPNSPYIFTLQTIDRKKFLSGIYQSHAYEDDQIPIPNFQKTQSYSSIIEMAELLDLHTSDDVLEIGTGSGYFSAILFQHCNMLITIERIRNLCGFAQKHLREQFPEEIQNKKIQIKHENMSHCKDLFEEESFNKIICTCEISQSKQSIETIIPLLKQNGILVIPTKKSYMVYTKSRQGKAFLLEEKKHNQTFCEYKARKE